LPNPARLVTDGTTVRDEITGLEWSVAFTERVDYAGAVAHCDSRPETDGESWRLPTRIELVSLVDRTRNPAIDERAFPETPADYFWSASPVPTAPGSRYSVYFGVGETAWGAEDQVAAHARCVRSGHRAPEPRLVAEGGGVTDTATGLEWEQEAPDVELGVDAARTYCDGLSLAGTGWRLPSPKELQTLVEPAASAADGTLLDTAVFSSSPAASAWAYDGPSVPAMTVRFTDGFTGIADTGTSHPVRCVR
jgi:hypothetical protein